MVRAISRGVYVVVAVMLLLGAVPVLLLGTGLLPERVARTVRQFGGGEGPGVHLMQEMATLMVLGALVCLWCIRNYERSLYLHWAMTVFWVLFALVHWFDYEGRFEAGAGQVVVSLPAAVFVALGVVRARTP